MPRCPATSIPISHAPKNVLAAPLEAFKRPAPTPTAGSSDRALAGLLRRISAQWPGILAALPERPK